MDPITAAVLLGTVGVSMYQAEQQKKASLKAKNDAEDDAVRNKNQLIEEGYNKRKQALGLGQKQPTGLAASQSGGVLTSVTDGNQASGL